MRSFTTKMFLLTAASICTALPANAYRFDPAAQAALRQVGNAQDQISRDLDNLWRNFESSSDYQQALSEVRQTRSAFEQARADALASWHQTSQYKSAQIRIWKLQQQLEADRDQPEKVAELADELLWTRSMLSTTESNLLDDSDKTKTARYAMIDAQAKAAALRENFLQSIQSDPQWRAARRQLDQAVRIASMAR